ncbi:MAG: histidinol-phosphatase HisJ family protein [Eubacteriales bacterium]
MAITTDYHLHTYFSGDSEAPMEDMVKQAISLGLTHICFTEHMDMDQPPAPNGEILNFEVNTDSYLFELITLKEKYAKEIAINFGIELGLNPAISRKLAAYIKSFDFDFVIGSTHLCNGIDPYFPEYFVGKSDEEAHREFFQCTLDNIKSFSNYDVYGHLDYIVRYGQNKDTNYSYNKHSDLIDEILKKLIYKEKGLEVNTAGLKKGLRDVHPYTDILKRYKELGGEIITIGSDAHTPSDMAFGYDHASAVLKECGFQYYCTFDKRMANFIPLK